MEITNTPLIFQQELNTFYKDILNCEIVAPTYWAGKIPETFFLRKRKWIDAYQDWGWDEVLDYIKFWLDEYAMIKSGTNIKVKKRVENPDTSNVWTLYNTDRLVEPTWYPNFPWTIWAYTITNHFINPEWTRMYVFTLANYQVETVSTKELFISEYVLEVPNNVNYAYWLRTVKVDCLSWLLETGKVQWTFWYDWKNIFIYVWALRKFLQISMSTEWDIRTLSRVYTESTNSVDSTYSNITDVKTNHNCNKIYFTTNTNKVWEVTFSVNDITSDTAINMYPFTEDSSYNWISFNWDWTSMYLTGSWKIYQLNLSTKFDLSSASSTGFSALVWTTPEHALTMCTSNDWMYFFVNQNNNLVCQLWFDHATTLATQQYSPEVHHSFKNNFQSVKGNWIYWDWDTQKCTGRVDQGKFLISPMTWQTWTFTKNELAWCYIMLIGWWTQADLTKWTWAWQILPIRANENQDIEVDTGWDDAPNETTYKIFQSYWEVLAFIWWDWLYTINNDTNVNKLQWLAVKVIDADWTDGRIFAVLENGNVVVSATMTSDWSYVLTGWYSSAYFNASSLIWNTIWALRIIPFQDIVVIFSKTWIYVIKQSTRDVNAVTFYDFKMSLAFGFLGLHSFNALCPYNTGIYFVSNKNTFLSLNIEESYYNKYKITTEDMWVDIQQWLDNIKEWDEVAIWINTDTIYLTWNSDDKATIFQYDTYYSFRHRRETKLLIKNVHIDTNETYLWPISYRYNLRWVKLDDRDLEYEQHLRFFNWESDIFSLKTILYHKLYLWVNTDLDSVVNYKARLSDWIYEYRVPLNNVTFLQKSSNLTAEKVLGNSILWYQPLWWCAEKLVVWTYLSDVDVLEIPLGLTYSLLEFTISGDFEIGWNLIWTLVHDNHLTPYEDVVAYLDE